MFCPRIIIYKLQTDILDRKQAVYEIISLYYRYDTFEMLRENLDTVLKDLLEFKKYENIDSKYPGTHLDLQNLQKNFLKNILPNRAHTDIKSKFHHPKFPYDIKDTLSQDILGSSEFDITTKNPAPTLDYTDAETPSSPEGLRSALEFETTKYVDLDNSPSTKTITVSKKKKKWEKSKETVIHSILTYMHLNNSTNKPDKSEIVYRIRRYLNRELKRVPLQNRSVKHKIHHYFFNNKHDHVKRFYKFDTTVTRNNILKSTYNNKINNLNTSHIELSNFPKPKFRKIPKSKRMKIGRKLQMYNKRNFIPLNRKRQTRKAKESTELKPVIQSQSSVSSPFTETTTESSLFEEKPFNLVQQDLAKGDAALKARFLFKSCMNYEILEKRGHQPLLDLLNLLGGWPILDHKWKDDEFSWIELMAKLRLYNNDILISEWVGPDIKNSDEFVIQFDQTSLGTMILYSTSPYHVVSKLPL